MKLLGPPGIQCEGEPTGVLQSHARLLQKAVQSRPELPSFSHRLVAIVCMENPLLSVLVLKCANCSFKLKCSVKAGSSSGCLC